MWGLTESPTGEGNLGPDEITVVDLVTGELS
jgi:hypothetical protein